QDLSIETIHNFVDTQVYRPTRNTELRSQFAPPGVPLLVHASNFRPVKRVLDAIRIFDHVQQETDCRLIMMGIGPDRQAAEDLVHSLGHDERVHFLDNQESILDLLSVADLLLLPSETESFGLVALEAMSCGVPVLASDVGGLRELVESGRTGFLCPRGNPEAFAMRALQLLQDRGLYEQVAGEARQSAVTRFDTSVIVPRYEAHYQRVLES
ncbi:MAG: glycosyltransferase, partial [Calditrichaeota bacterium]|nr:glycosyltransferase [Calditrichota bacterium]